MLTALFSRWYAASPIRLYAARCCCLLAASMRIVAGQRDDRAAARLRYDTPQIGARGDSCLWTARRSKTG
jgi:hypothetical protein